MAETLRCAVERELRGVLEVSLINEQADDACDLIFHLFFCIPFQEGKQSVNPE